MPQYELTLKFDEQELNTIHRAGQQVVLVKSVGATGSSTDVAWVAFSPFESNTVTWEEKYGIYASSVAIVDGAEIQKISDTDAPEEETVTFMDSGVFSVPVRDSTLKKGEYCAINHYNTLTLLTFGMQQGVEVNSQSMPVKPINAVSVPKTDTAVFTPYEKVTAFLAAEIESSFIITKITSPSTVFTFGGGVDSIAATYNSSTGKFSQSTG